MIGTFKRTRGDYTYTIVPEDIIVTDASIIHTGFFFAHVKHIETKWRFAVNLAEHLVPGQLVSEKDVEDIIWEFGCKPRAKVFELQEFGNAMVKISI